MVAINGEGEAATENDKETVVEDAKANGNGVHGEAELGDDGDHIEILTTYGEIRSEIRNAWGPLPTVTCCGSPCTPSPSTASS